MRASIYRLVGAAVREEVFSFGDDELLELEVEVNGATYQISQSRQGGGRLEIGEKDGMQVLVIPKVSNVIQVDYE